MDAAESSRGAAGARKKSWRSELVLAYQSLGVVYGEVVTSPLYVYKSAFAGGDIEHSEGNEEIYGVLSLVFWTLTLITLLKYVLVVLRADDDGEGGTFALYSLICRRVGAGLLPGAGDDLKGQRGGAALPPASSVRTALQQRRELQWLLLLFALLGTSMVIGDGVLTPAVSVLSAVSGLKLSMVDEQHQYVLLPVTCVILVGLFALQHYGTHRVGFLFAPIICLWLLCISIIGVYNIIYWNPHVYKALSPYYMYRFLQKTQYGGWMSLGGILLCVTGSEAMYADLGHFSQSSIKLAFTMVVYPSLILAYMGQAAYISRHHSFEKNHHIGFYVSVPEKIRWPVLGIAILAAVVGSQAVITEINWILMLLCLALTIGFRDTKHMANAQGLAVITVMIVTTCLMSLVIILCWNKNIVFALSFLLFFGAIEAIYFSASLVKFHEGAWVPIILSFIFLMVMCVWHYGTAKKYEFDVENKVSISWLLNLGPSLGIVRVRGIGLIHTDLISGIPAIFSHFVTNLPAFHQVLVFLCIKSVSVPHVQPEERFLVGRIGLRQYSLYRVVVRYGYRDVQQDSLEFEKTLVSSIAEFIRSGDSDLNGHLDGSDSPYEKLSVISKGLPFQKDGEPEASPESSTPTETNPKLVSSKSRRVRFVLPENAQMNSEVRSELQELTEAREAGMTFIMGRSYMRAKSGSSMIKRIAINFIYEFLMRNSRSPAYAANVPHVSTLEVGMVCQV
ncbi:hypothetical protein PVAP13_4KG170000 [Panicum virgatum]|uniref:Potassium transporter n=1 Tax=Panicum virgatum TaxID=38727 RepID=A0A8T0TKS0_PANVG|nr:hypothetical protein PVAP13_4KG170000 [Panicum virgatum]